MSTACWWKGTKESCPSRERGFWGLSGRKNDHPSIGLLLCKSKNDLVAEYALKDMSKPMGVSAYKVTNSLPEELQRQLPSIEDIEKRIQKE